MGDTRPPKDEQGNVEEPWSKRFLLIGDAEGGTIAHAGAHGAAAQQAPPGVVGNLHARSANFVGRAREIVTVVKAFDEAEARRVCVYGSGGLGKTELARAVARWYMERERVGAVLWASASHVEGEYKLRDLASLLGVAMKVFPLPVNEQSMFEEQKRVVRDFLADSRALVLLDNWETIEKEHRRELWDFARSLPEEVRVLITSRDVLQGKDEVTDEPRGIWTSLDLSYNVLPDPEQTLFRRMCVLLAPAPAEDIAAVTETPNPRPVLDTLIKRSLVRMREGAYSLLPIVRDYAQDKLTTAGQDPRDLHGRAVNHYGQKGTIEDALTASDHLFELAARIELRDAAEAFVEYVHGFYHDLVMRGYWAEARSKTGQLIAVARALGNKQMEAQVIGEMSNRYYQIGEYESAMGFRRKALSLYEEIKDTRGVGASLHHLGMLAHEQGNYDEAARLYRQSLDILKEVGDKRGAAGVLHQLGVVVAQAQGDYGEAARLYERSLKLCSELGDKNGIAESLGQLGQLAGAQGQMKEALTYLLRAFVIFEELHAPYRRLTLKDIASVRNAVGEEQFAAWLSELSADAERITLLLRQDG